MDRYIKIGSRNEILGIYNTYHQGTVKIATPIEVEQSPYLYRVEDGSRFVKTTEFVSENTKDQNTIAFRVWRSEKLNKYDLLGLFIMRRDIDPETGLTYAPITDEERQFRVAVLNFTDQITEATTKDDYPQVPIRLR